MHPIGFESASLPFQSELISIGKSYLMLHPQIAHQSKAGYNLF